MIGINIQDGEIYPASFADKGPDECIRHARIFGGVRGVSCSLSCVTIFFLRTHNSLNNKPMSLYTSLVPLFLIVVQQKLHYVGTSHLYHHTAVY